MPSIYRTGSSQRGSIYRRTTSPSSPQPEQKKDEGGGFWGAVSRIPGDVGRDFYSAAVNAPAGVYNTSKAVAEDVRDVIDPRQIGRVGKRGEVKPGDIAPRTRRLAGEVARSTIESYRHPLRHPGDTILNTLAIGSLGAGAGARVATAGKAVRAGQRVSGAAKALATKPKPGRRVIRVNDLETQGVYSRNAAARGVQKVKDRRRQTALDTAPEDRSLLQRRSAAKGEKQAEKYLRQERKVTEARERFASSRLMAMGHRLSAEEQMALRLVAEEAPVKRRIAASELRAARASDKAEAKRHRERITLKEGALKYLDEDPTGRPVLKSPKLQRVYDQMSKVATTREERLKMLDLLSEEAAKRHKTDVGRAALGQIGDEPPAARFQRQYRRNRKQMLADYETRFGNKLDTDDARELFPEYVADREGMSPEVHEAASKVVNDKYREMLRRPPSRNKSVALLSGGAGAGKTTAVRVSPDDFDIVYDTTLSNAKTATRKIDAALRSGRKVDIVYVYRHPGDAVKGAVKRANDEGRTVPLEVITKSHADSNKVIRQLAEKYKGRPVTISVIDNSRGPEAAKAIPLDELPVLDYTKVADEVKAAYEAERAAGRVTGRHAAGFEAGRGSGRADARQPAKAEVGFEASPRAVYVGDPARKSRLTGRPKVGAQTIGHPRLPESVRKRYTGRAKATATERLDTTNIVGERGLEAARLTSIFRARDQLAKAGTPTPSYKDDLFMRLDELPSSQRLPGAVREFLDDPDSLADFTPEESRGMVERIRSSMFSDEWQLSPAARAEFEELAEQGKGVFVPRRVVGSLAKRRPELSDLITKKGQKFVDEVNNAQKLAVVYLKPGYILPQVVSNAFLNLTQQGFAAPRNIARAVRLNKRLGPDYTAVVDDLMGEGFIRQLGGEGLGGAGRLASATAGGLGKIVDRPFRRASFLHEAAKKGYKSPEQIKRLLDDDSLADDLTEITTRANQEIIDFGELGEIEQAVVRRAVFVYPWVKGSTMYAGRFLRDKPVQSAALAQLGTQAQDDPSMSLGSVPSYLEGSFKVGDRLVNPASASPFGTPAGVGRAISGLFTGDRAYAAQPAGFASPFVSALLARLTGRNQAGFPAGSLPDTLREEFFEGQPLVQVLRGFGALGGPRSKLYNDSAEDALLRYLIGGFYPRDYNEAELRKRAARGD